MPFSYLPADTRGHNIATLVANLGPVPNLGALHPTIGRDNTALGGPGVGGAALTYQQFATELRNGLQAGFGIIPVAGDLLRVFGFDTEGHQGLNGGYNCIGWALGTNIWIFPAAHAANPGAIGLIGDLQIGSHACGFQSYETLLRMINYFHLTIRTYFDMPVVSLNADVDHKITNVVTALCNAAGNVAGVPNIAVPAAATPAVLAVGVLPGAIPVLPAAVVAAPVAPLDFQLALYFAGRNWEHGARYTTTINPGDPAVVGNATANTVNAWTSKLGSEPLIEHDFNQLCGAPPLAPLAPIYGDIHLVV